MTTPRYGRDDGRRLRGALLLCAGIALVALPETVASVTGLVLLYTLAALAVVAGGINLVGALRVRETAWWLLPASVVTLLAGLATLAAPAALGSALTRGVGVAVVVAGGLVLLSQFGRGHALAESGARRPALPR